MTRIDPVCVPQPILTSPLQNKDYTLIIDKSASMIATDTPTGQSRWKACEETVIGLANKIIKLDSDGIDLYLFNGKVSYHPAIKKADDVKKVFEEDPEGNTLLEPVLDQALKNFFAKRRDDTVKSNGEMILIVTDGEPQDRPKVATTIIDATKKLQPQDKLSIAFIQVGKDAGATAYLQALDDDLKKSYGATKDIVKTYTMAQVGDKGLNQVLTEIIEETAS
jgi:uncharacterized protein YegL